MIFYTEQIIDGHRRIAEAGQNLFGNAQSIGGIREK